jgi:NAD(P)-dependent dehydrogenase (short-subunit alcohol dehydrogenase family)
MVNTEKTDKLKGQVVIVTGASEGIGRAMAFELAKEGADLVLASRSIEKLEDLARAVQELGNHALAVPTDVTRPEEMNALLQSAASVFGRVDVLINNVGRGLRKPLVETTEEDWNQLVATNLSSVLYGCRAALPFMESQKRGQIINIASRSGRVGEANLAAYCAVKHGVIGLTKALAEEVGMHGIHVNAICPGPVRTARMEKILPQVDKSGWLLPEEVAAVVAFLACSAGYLMQGQVIDIF